MKFLIGSYTVYPGFKGQQLLLVQLRGENIPEMNDNIVLNLPIKDEDTQRMIQDNIGRLVELNLELVHEGDE